MIYLDSAATSLLKPETVAPAVLPDPEAHAAYEKKYALYLRAIECLNGLWPEMQEFIENGQ